MSKNMNKYINEQNSAGGVGAGDSWPSVQFMRPWVPSPRWRIAKKKKKRKKKKELLDLLSALFSTEKKSLFSFRAVWKGQQFGNEIL